MRNSPENVEYHIIMEKTCSMANIRAVTSAREIFVENMFMSQRTRVIAKNARPLSMEAVRADRRFYEGHVN